MAHHRLLSEIAASWYRSNGSPSSRTTRSLRTGPRTSETSEDAALSVNRASDEEFQAEPPVAATAATQALRRSRRERCRSDLKGMMSSPLALWHRINVDDHRRAGRPHNIEISAAQPELA